MIHKLYNYFLTKKRPKNQSYITKWVSWQMFKYLRYALPKFYNKLSIDKLNIKSENEIIVSLTSIPGRINNVHLVVKSILNQTYKPSKIILWLGKEYFPDGEENLPSVLLRLKQKGLEIEFCEDLKPHTKYYYAFKKYPNKLLVTVDDDMLYSIHMLEKLYEFHKLYPNSVIANRVREISFTNERIDHYRKWKINEYKNSNPTKLLLATGVGGVLYQPNVFSEKLYDKNLIKDLALNVDDIWLKANQLSNDISVVWTNYFCNPFMEISDSQMTTLNSNNVFEGENNIKIEKVFSYFSINKATFNE